MANLQNLTINDSGFLQLPVGTASTRPDQLSESIIRYNNDLSDLEFYTDKWSNTQRIKSSIVQSGLACHLDANDPESYGGSGNIWYDISGNLRNFTWVNTPQYNVDRTGYFNTLNNRCQGPPSNSFGIDSNSGYTIFLVCEQITLNESGAFKFYDAGNERGIFAHVTWDDDKVYFDQGRAVDSSDRIEAKSLGSKTWNIWVFQRNSNSDYTAIWRNNIPIANSHDPLNNLNLNSTPVDLGTSNNYGGDFSDWDARLAGFLVYNRNLTDDEIKTNINAISQTIPIDNIDNIIGRSEEYPALSGWTIKDANPSATSGIYYISPEGTDDSFQVYCEMETDGGGWVLIDSLLDGESISSRTPGANLNPRQTRGSYLPFYSWSPTPQLLGKSREFTGFAPWRTLNVISERGRRYPTDPDPNNGSSGVSGDFDYAIDNGNARVGTRSWLYTGNGRIGTIWIGSGNSSTMAIGYTGNTTGLGDNFGSSDSSSYVR